MMNARRILIRPALAVVGLCALCALLAFPAASTAAADPGGHREDKDASSKAHPDGSAPGLAGTATLSVRVLPPPPPGSLPHPRVGGHDRPSRHHVSVDVDSGSESSSQSGDELDGQEVPPVSWSGILGRGVSHVSRPTAARRGNLPFTGHDIGKRVFGGMTAVLAGAALLGLSTVRRKRLIRRNSVRRRTT